ncbi:MAG: 3-keto-disaccharide hydrolase [Planctomycetota bacterium]
MLTNILERGPRPQSLIQLAFLFACVVFACVVPVATATGDVPTQSLEAAKKSPDFAIMGEFVGPVEQGESEYERIAVQVRTVGDGRFEALQYLGGLPGEKSHQKQLASLIGRRSGGFLVLSGGPWALVVHPDHCLVINEKGDQIGRLKRMVRESPTMGAKPPKDATVVFDGSDAEQFTKAKVTEDGLLMEGATVKPMFQDFNLHCEFRLPLMPGDRGQGRANSGFYLQSRYEVQVLDSFAKPPKNNGCGALYQYREPDVNACLPPLQWQTYDIMFTAPRWDADNQKIRNARITVWLNGTKVHDNQELESKTGSGSDESPTLLPIRLQDHGDPVRFRNLWVIDRGLSTGGDFPVHAPQSPKKKQSTKKDAKQDAEKKGQQDEDKEASKDEASKQNDKKDGNGKDEGNTESEDKDQQADKDKEQDKDNDKQKDKDKEADKDKDNDKE